MEGSPDNNNNEEQYQIMSSSSHHNMHRHQQQTDQPKEEEETVINQPPPLSHQPPHHRQQQHSNNNNNEELTYEERILNRQQEILRQELPHLGHNDGLGEEKTRSSSVNITSGSGKKLATWQLRQIEAMRQSMNNDIKLAAVAAAARGNYHKNNNIMLSCSMDKEGAGTKNFIPEPLYLPSRRRSRRVQHKSGSSSRDNKQQGSNTMNQRLSKSLNYGQTNNNTTSITNQHRPLSSSFTLGTTDNNNSNGMYKGLLEDVQTFSMEDDSNIAGGGGGTLNLNYDMLSRLENTNQSRHQNKSTGIKQQQQQQEERLTQSLQYDGQISNLPRVQQHRPYSSSYTIGQQSSYHHQMMGLGNDDDTNNDLLLARTSSFFDDNIDHHQSSLYQMNNSYQQQQPAGGFNTDQSNKMMPLPTSSLLQGHSDNNMMTRRKSIYQPKQSVSSFTESSRMMEQQQEESSSCNYSNERAMLTQQAVQSAKSVIGTSCMEEYNCSNNNNEYSRTMSSSSANYASPGINYDDNNNSNNNDNNMKRRRLNSNDELMLAMLTDTIVDDTTSSPPDTNNARSNSGGRVEEDSAFDRLNQSDISLLPYDNSPITMNYNNDTEGTTSALDGSTQRLFATIFLGGGNSNSSSIGNGESASNVNNSQGSSGSRLHIVNAMPPPPLASMKDLSSNDFNNNTLNSNMMGSINTSNMVATTTFPPSIHPVIKCTTTGNQLHHTNDSLPLPLPSALAKEYRQKKQKKQQQSNNKATSHHQQQQQKKNINYFESPKTKKPINHIPTPSSATISALSREVQSKMMQQISSSSTSTAVSNNKSQDNVPSTVTAAAAAAAAAAATSIEDIPQFASSMEASQASQQSIHDWDRKMGLRRAHSKTMRESCRSRKRVLDFLKSDGANLLLLSKNTASVSKQQDTNTPSLRTSSVSSDTSHDVEEKTTDFSNEVNDDTKRKNYEGIVDEAAAQVQEDSAGLSQQEEQEFMSVLPEQSEVPSPQAEDDSDSEDECDGEETTEANPENQIDIDTMGTSFVNDDTTQEQPTIDIQKSHDESSESDLSKELELMFRRASLDCVSKGLLPNSELQRPIESDCKQNFAKSA